MTPATVRWGHFGEVWSDWVGLVGYLVIPADIIECCKALETVRGAPDPQFSDPAGSGSKPDLDILVPAGSGPDPQNLPDVQPDPDLDPVHP